MRYIILRFLPAGLVLLSGARLVTGGLALLFLIFRNAYAEARPKYLVNLGEEPTLFPFFEVGLRPRRVPEFRYKCEVMDVSISFIVDHGVMPQFSAEEFEMSLHGDKVVTLEGHTDYLPLRQAASYAERYFTFFGWDTKPLRNYVRLVGSGALKMFCVTKSLKGIGSLHLYFSPLSEQQSVALWLKFEWPRFGRYDEYVPAHPPPGFENESMEPYSVYSEPPSRLNKNRFSSDYDIPQKNVPLVRMSGVIGWLFLALLSSGIVIFTIWRCRRAMA